MLEDEEGKHRYEFFSRAIRKDNLNNDIAYYEPIVRSCKNLGTGSTYIDTRYSVEEGNRLYRNLMQKGFRQVTERSFA